MTDQLDHIEQKARQLAQALEALRRDNAALAEENKQLKASLEERSERLEELTQRLSNAQSALGRQRGEDGEPESSRKLRKQIDQHMREVDKCIAWLQNA